MVMRLLLEESARLTADLPPGPESFAKIRRIRHDSGEVFHFGEFTLQVAERRLTQRRNVVHLSPKAHDVLVRLVRQAGRLVTKDDLLSQVWPDSSVEEGILTVHISALRKAFGDDKRSSSYIDTVSGWGYRFIAPVTREADHGTDDPGVHAGRTQRLGEAAVPALCRIVAVPVLAQLVA